MTLGKKSPHKCYSHLFGEPLASAVPTAHIKRKTSVENIYGSSFILRFLIL